VKDCAKIANSHKMKHGIDEATASILRVVLPKAWEERK
jgi:hypothetical protein